MCYVLYKMPVVLHLKNKQTNKNCQWGLSSCKNKIKPAQIMCSKYSPFPIRSMITNCCTWLKPPVFSLGGQRIDADSPHIHKKLSNESLKLRGFFDYSELCLRNLALSIPSTNQLYGILNKIFTALHFLHWALYRRLTLCFCSHSDLWLLHY